MIIKLAADIVSAHVSSNSVAAADLPVFMKAVYYTLARLGREQVTGKEKPKPAVSKRSSVKRDAIVCIECGQKRKMLKRHLKANHNLTASEYRTRWGLDADFPLVAPSFSKKRKELAIKTGLGLKPSRQTGKAETSG